MLNNSNFLIAKLASSDDDGVPMLHKGILVSPKCTAVTDGRLAVRVSGVEADQSSLVFDLDGLEPAEWWTDFMLDKTSALKIATSIPAKPSETQSLFGLVDATTEGEKNKAMLAVNQVSRQDIVRSIKLDCEFPDLEKLIPEKDKARFTIHLNPELLLSLMKVVAQFCKSHRIPSIELRAYSGRKPLRIDAVADNQEMLALLMPTSEADFGEGESKSEEAPLRLTARLRDIKRLSDEDRATLRKYVQGGDRTEARYPNVPEVREILDKLATPAKDEAAPEAPAGEVISLPPPEPPITYGRGKITVKLSELSKLTEADREQLKLYVVSVAKGKAVYRDLPSVRDILSKIEKQGPEVNEDGE